MNSIITSCSTSPSWLELGLLKLAQAEDLDIADNTQQTPENDTQNPIYQFVNPAEWGSGGKRYVGVAARIKTKINRELSPIVRGYPDTIPISEIFQVLASLTRSPLPLGRG